MDILISIARFLLLASLVIALLFCLLSLIICCMIGLDILLEAGKAENGKIMNKVWKKIVEIRTNFKWNYHKFGKVTGKEVMYIDGDIK